jgi:hypothetical protein
MVESLQHPRPTDSTLSRHYESVINAEIEQCVNDQGALEQLISRYEDHTKTFVQPIEAPQILAEPFIKAEVNAEPAKEPTVSQQTDIIAEPLSVRPTDSALARHYDTMIKVIAKEQTVSEQIDTIAEPLSVRPTDSTLARHYDTMMNKTSK